MKTYILDLDQGTTAGHIARAAVESIAFHWTLDRRFQPKMPKEQRDTLHRRWQKAVNCSLDWATDA